MNSRLTAVPIQDHRREGTCNFCNRRPEPAALSVSQSHGVGGTLVVRFCKPCLKDLSLAAENLEPGPDHVSVTIEIHGEQLTIEAVRIRDGETLAKAARRVADYHRAEMVGFKDA